MQNKNNYLRGRKMPIVSIIIPVYNAEKYLGRCIDSVLQQEWTDFELILADDGSTDDSGILCDGYAAKDARIRVLHKGNSGVSDTRNQCISIARGRYLQFIDSDDWITPDATKLLVEAAERSGAGMVIADFYRVAGERLIAKGAIEEEGLLSKEEFAECMMENPADFYYGVLWNKLYRRDIIKMHQLSMNVDISWCEDFLFNLEYFCYADSYYVLQAPVYYYVKRKGSLVSQGMSMSKTIKMKAEAFECFNQFYRNVWDGEEYEKKRRGLYRFFIDVAGDGFVPPILYRGVQKLGSERISLHRQTAMEEGILSDFYCSRKLFEQEIIAVAEQYGLKAKDAVLLLYVKEPRRVHNRKELADILGMPKKALSRSLQILQAFNMIQVSEEKDADTGFRELILSPLPAAEPILAALRQVQDHYDAVRFAGLTEEEIADYRMLTEKVKSNICETLK